MNLRRGLFGPAATILALVMAPPAVSAQEWTSIGVCTAINLEAISFSDAQNAFAAGQGYLVHSGDGGRSWAPLPGVSGVLHDVGFRGASLGLAVGDGGLILRTIDGGQSWSEVESGTTSDLHTVALGDGGMAVAAGFNVVLRSLDGGATWTQVAAGDFNFRGSAASGTDHAWLVGGEHGVVLATTDGGASWTTQSSGTTEELRGVFFVSPSRGWIAGAGGTLLNTEDGGTTWQPRSVGTQGSLNAVYFVSASTGWVVGSEGAILRTQDAGVSWTAESSLNVDELLDVSFSVAGQGCAVGIVCTVLLRDEPVTGVIDGALPPRPVIHPLANPAHGIATLRFGLHEETSVQLGVFDVQGRLVAKLVDDRLPAGWHEVRWNARGLAPGLYLARLSDAGATASTKIVLGH